MAAARFTLLSAECVRIEYAPDGRFTDAPTLLAAYRERSEPSARHTPPIVIADVALDDQSHRPLVMFTERFELRFTPRGKGLTRATLEVQLRGRDQVWRPGDKQTSNLGGTLSTLDGVRGPEPLGEGLLSRDGWYFIEDSHNHVIEEGWMRPRDAHPQATDGYLLVYGDDYRAGLRAFTGISGRVPVPRRALFGSWYSRYWPHTSAEFRQIVTDYESHGLPLDVMVLDMDWHRDGWTGWSWNRELLPDAEDLLRWLHARGLTVTLNLHPADGVGPHEDRYADFMRAIGRDPASHQTVPFDAGDRAYMSALFEHVHRPLERDHGGGVDFWWVDWQQDKFVRSAPNLTNLQWLNRLYFEHTRSAPSDDEPRRRGVSFSRWAGNAAERRWGDHRHPMHFSGDAHTGWAMLRFQIPFTVTAGNVGCFFWSHDIGGHFGPRIEEATARWVQFGGLSAAVRMHSARVGVLDRRPWTYEPRFFESMRDALALRASLMPYLYNEVRRACRESVPLLRPMYLDHGAHERSYRCDGQYLLGERLLAAPITHAGVGTRCVATQPVWFPPAQVDQAAGGWRRWDTGERFVDGDEAIVGAAINETPLFVREGAPIVLQDIGPRMTAGLGEHATVRVWAPAGLDAPRIFADTLEEDDGVTDDPEDRLVARTPVRAEWAPTPRGTVEIRLTIGPTFGHYAGQPERRRWTLEIGGISEVISTADAAGRPLHGLEFDPHALGGCVRIGVAFGPGAGLDATGFASVEVRVADSDTIDLTHAARRFAEAFDVQLDPRAADLAAALHHAVVVASDGHNRVPLHEASSSHVSGLLAIGAGIGAWNCGLATRVCDTFGWLEGGEISTEVIDVVGSRTYSYGRGRLMLTSSTHSPPHLVRSRTADVVMPDRPLSSPPIGVRAARVVRCEAMIGGHPIAWSHFAERQLSPVPAEAWRVVGPFGWNWARSITEQAYSPELGGGHGLDVRDWHDAHDGSWVRWTSARRGEKWPVDFRDSLGTHQGLGYAMTTITSSRRQQSRLVIDSADKVEVWVNREKVYSQDGFETEAALAGGAAITLPQGRSIVLVKCASGGGGWGFSMALDGEHEVIADAEPEHVEHRAASPSFG